MEIAPGIHRFDTYRFNWYVVEEAGRLTLVDAGFPGHYGVFAAGLASIGRSVRDVAAVILTHAHADHMGIAARVARESGAPVMVHRDDVAAAGRIWQLPWWGLLSNGWRPFLTGMLVHATLNGVFGRTCVPDAVPFADGDVLDVPGRPNVVHLPGHTPGEVAFFLPERRVLITGDSVVICDLFTGGPTRPQLARPQINADHRRADQSLDRIAGLGPATILPGHGGPWQGDLSDAVRIARGA